MSPISSVACASSASRSLVGGDGDDTLGGQLGDDTLDGGAGNDALRGEWNSDTYLFGAGGGHDTISDDDHGALGGGGTDVLVLQGLGAGDITLTRPASTGDVLVTLKSSGETIRILSHYHSSGQFALEQIRLADGTTWSVSQINSLVETGATFAPGAPRFGTAASDSLTGSGLGEFLWGEAGDDTINGGGGNDGLFGVDGADRLVGGDGDDTLTGQLGDDTLEGGAGNDALKGDWNSDTYIFGVGGGHDTISDNDYGAGGGGGLDTLELHGLNPGEVILSNPAGTTDLLVTIKATNETVRVLNHGYSTGQFALERFRFADGTIWDSTQIAGLVQTGATLLPGAPQFGTSGPDSLSGTAQAEYIWGQAGADTIAAGDGDDVVFGVDAGDLLQGGSGNDTLNGQLGDDTLVGGAGNDGLLGEWNSDTYVFGPGDGHDTISDNDHGAGGGGGIDKLVLDGLYAGDVTLITGAGSNDLVVTLRSSGETIRVFQHFYSSGQFALEQIRFADGTTWSTTQMLDLVQTGGTFAPGAPIFGTNAGESLSGTGLGEYIWGEAGADTIHAGDGDDAVAGEDGGDYLIGGSGADTLYGQLGDDTLEGGAGNDILRGEWNSDTYLFGVGSGHDVIGDDDHGVGGGGGTDTLVLQGLNAGDITLTVPTGTNDLLLTVKTTGETMRVAEHFGPSGRYLLEQIRFADGTVWTASEIYSIVQTGASLAPGAPIFGTTGPDSLSGSALGEYIWGQAGSDTISAGGGNDVVIGVDGGDRLLGDAPVAVIGSVPET